MSVVWGVVVVALSTVCWGGQIVASLAPDSAQRLGLVEHETDVDPVFWADGRGEALWDAMTLWTMVVAGVLLVMDHSWWPHFGLLAGGMYIYFAGRGLLTRLTMQRRGLRIGSTSSLTTAYIALSVWGVMGMITAIAAVVALST